MNLAKYAWISLALCIMALILFSSIGAPLLDMSNDNMYEEVSEEVLRHLTRIVGAEGLGTISAQGDRRLALGFNVELFPPMPNRSGPNMIKEGEEWEEFSMTEAPEPGPLSPGPGDWVVSGTEVRKNEVIILTGNLIVEPGGNLTLINCTLIMNCTYDGEWKIKVESGSIMNVLKGSVIRAYDPYYEFMFYVYGRLIMRDSELHECGYDRDHPGLWIKSDEGIMIENCTISQNDWYGIVCYRSSNIMITGCEINWNDWHGIYCDGSLHTTITDCNIDHNGYGIGCWNSFNTTIIRCNITNNEEHGLYVFGFFVVSAAYNWWGSPDGPEYKAEGDPDDPEEVYSYYGPRYIIYEPWLTKPYSPIDDIPPSVIISSPEERSCIMGITVVSVDAYDNETGIVRVEFYLNETLVFTDYDYPYEYVWNTTGCPDGAYTIKVIAYDLAGNVAEHEVTVIVDNTAPSIGKSVISPKSPTEEDDVTVKVSVVDALSGVEEVILSYSTDGGATWTNVTMVLSSNGYYTATIPGQPAGTTVLYKIYARDAVGNWAVSLEYSYKVGARHVLPVSTTYILVSVAAVIAIIAIGIHRFMRRKAG